MKIEKTYNANIYVGFREEYSENIHSLEEAEAICQEYCDKMYYCFTLTTTKFIYTNGKEPGCIVGLINYPRFPSTGEDIKKVALDLAKIFLDRFNQLRISVVCSDNTYMLEKNIL